VVANNNFNAGGIKINGVSGQKMAYMTITGNLIDSAGILNGIELSYCSKGVIAGNVIEGATAAVYLSNCDTITPIASQAIGSAVPSRGLFLGMQGSGNNLQSLRSAANLGQQATGVDLALAMAPYGYNGSNMDQMRNNQEVTLLASAARTTTQAGSDIVNYNGLSALIVVLDVTSAGTGSITLTIEGKDSASGKYYTILAGAAVTTNSTNRYRVGPTLAAAANSVAQDYLPRIFRINVTANNGTASHTVWATASCAVSQRPISHR
jgi:hypothetical protein